MSAWGQASSTSNKYKFRGTIATREYTPVMPYYKTLHEQSLSSASISKKVLNTGDKVTLFEVGEGKGFASDGTFNDGKKVVDFPNFAICATSYNGGIIHYRLTFHYTYGSGGSKYLDIYRHVADKKDGLAVIALQTPALFSQDETGRNQVNSINKVEIQCLNFDNRRFQIESCYFIEAMPDFNFNDIDGRYIGNAYIHPSYLIPSAGTIIYPAGEENDTPNYDDYIVEVKTTTNYTDSEGKVDWAVVDKNGKKDSTSMYNPTLVWSMKYSGFNGTAPYEDMSNVTYTTVDRWGGNAFWRWIFQKREVAAKAGAPEAGVTVPIADYKLWNSLYTGATEVTAKDCAENFGTSTNLVFGNLNTRTQYVDLKQIAGYSNTGTDAASGKWKRLMFENNNGTNLPGWKFTVNEGGVLKEVTGLEGANASGKEQYSYDLEASFKKYSEIYLHALSGNDVNVTALYLGTNFGDRPNDESSTNINDLDTYVKGIGDPDSHVDNGDGGYGDKDNVKAANYIDITAYDKLIVKTNDGTVPSFRFNRNPEDEAVLLNFDGNNTSYCSHNGDTWTVDLQKVKNASAGSLTGKAYLNCIKANYEQTLSLNEVSVVTCNTRLITAADFELHKEVGTTTTTPEANWRPVYGVVSSYHNPDYYTDLAGKECLEITTTSQNPRFVFNDGTDKRVEVKYDDPGQNYITKDGDKYSVNLDRINTEKGMVHLNGIFLQDANGSYICTAVVTKSNSAQANYTLTDTDMQHYYNSVYNGDFTNWINNGSVTPNTVNYMYYELNGNEHNECYDSTDPRWSTNMPIYVYKDNGEIDKQVGFLVNVDKDGKLIDNPERITMHIKDICLTKNKVEARQNHVDLGGEGPDNKSKLQTADTDNYWWQGFWQDGNAHSGAYFGHYNPNMGIYADITGYHTMIFKGEPNTEIELFFNTGTSGAVSYKIKLDDNTCKDYDSSEFPRYYKGTGYATLDLTDPALNLAMTANSGEIAKAGHIYLCAIKTAGTVGKLEYVRFVKDKDELAPAVRELTQNDFHTWNGTINATVTRKIAENYDGNLGASLGAGGVWLGINGSRGKEEQSYAEVTGYKWMKFEGTENAKVRVLANTWDDGSDWQAAKFDKTVTLDGNGVGYLDISNYQYFHVNVICNPNDGGQATLNKVLLLPDPRVDYVLEGNGVLGASAAKALADRAACVIDARTRVNNKEVIDLYTEQVYVGNSEVWNEAICLSDWNAWQLLKQGAKTTRYIRMGNPNCLVMMRGNFNSTFDPETANIGYEDIQHAQYWHGIRSMHHANTIIMSEDYDGANAHNVMTAGLFLVDGFPYRMPMKITNVKGNSMSYARILPTERAVVNTICVPFTVTMASPCGDSNSIFADAANQRVGLNGEETMCHFYKITDLVHNIGKTTETAGLLQQDHVVPNEYVFWFKQVEKLDAYTPYVFVNRHEGATRTGTRMEVYSGWAGAYPTILPTVDLTGKVNLPMNNSAHKTDLNSKLGYEDTYYLYGTNATKHTRDCWYFNSEGYLVKSHYLSTPTFRAVMKNLNRTIDMPFEDPQQGANARIKVVSFDDWMNGDEEVVAVKTILSDTEEEIVPVYSVSGILLRPAVKLSSALEGLPQGIYIVGDKKAIKK